MAYNDDRSSLNPPIRPGSISEDNPYSSMSDVFTVNPDTGEITLSDPYTLTTSNLASYSDVVNGFDAGGGTKTPAKLTIVYIQGFFKSIYLSWDSQYNLTNWKQYELQVSDDATNWYSLKFDGSDWKDQAGAATVVYSNHVSHSNLPLAGTTEDPVGITLYYRVRQRTNDNLTSEWSDIESASTYGIDEGSITKDAITTEKIFAEAVTAAKIKTATITADQIASDTITADKIAVGGSGKIYEQPLAPTVAYAFDTWIDSDNNTKYEHMYNVVSSRGGAGASVTSFDNTVGGAPADNSDWNNTYGNIPSIVGWFTTLYGGHTIIDGGRIEADSLKSWNYIEGVQGSKFNLATGYIETGDGEFRGGLNAATGTFTGDLEVGSDDANRQLSLGSKGLLVKDANGIIIHDLPDAAIQSGNYYCGHKYWYQGSSTYQIHDDTGFPLKTWTAIPCIVDNNTNAKMGMFKVCVKGHDSSGTSYGQITIYLRPYGVSWAIDSNIPTLYRFVDTNGTFYQIEGTGVLECPIGNDNKIEFWINVIPYDANRRVIITQLGVSI